MTNSALVNSVQESFLQEGREEIKTWMEVEVHQIIKEVSISYYNKRQTNCCVGNHK